MDIIIKSFNRPYYLDRCLYSIYNFGINFTGKLYILDDGTPQKYLDKISEKYPNVIIFKSEFYKEKSKLIKTFQTHKIKNIPIDLWFSVAKKASNYFLLLEDDIWFTKEFDFSFYEKTIINDKLLLLKLIWLGNNKLISGKTQNEQNEYLIYKPDVFTMNPFFYKIIFNLHRFGIHRIMKTVKLYTLERHLQYYSLYSVAGAVFKKEYFLSLWNNHINIVDESLQLSNAIKFIYKSGEMNFGRTQKEYLKTGFISSATNKKDNNTQIDMFQFNNVLNESWLKGDFLTTQDLKNDICEEMVIRVLENHKGENHIKGEEWKEWVLNFKNQFRNIGCKID